MTSYVYNTAATLDGFLADEHDSLDWLLNQPIDEGGPMNIADFMQSVGAIVMGRTTYEWVVNHLDEAGGKWPYPDHQSFVFTNNALSARNDSITFLAGDPAQHRATLEAAAAGKTVWVVGGGELAAQFAQAQMLDEVIISYAPATVGSGRPLFTEPFDFELIEWAHNGAFIVGRYRVVGARRSD